VVAPMQVPILDILGPQILREIVGGRLQGARSEVVPDEPTVRKERQRGDPVAEKCASHLREWQHSDDPALLLDEEVVRLMAEDVFQDVPEDREMKNRCPWSVQHETVPPQHVTRLESTKLRAAARRLAGPGSRHSIGGDHRCRLTRLESSCSAIAGASIIHKATAIRARRSRATSAVGAVLVSRKYTVDRGS